MLGQSVRASLCVRLDPWALEGRGARLAGRLELPKTIRTEKARQGNRGRPILLVLIGGLLLVGLVWAAVEIYGQAIEPAGEQSEVIQSE